MRVVWLSHFIPYPPRGGSRQRSYNLIRHLAAQHEVHVVMLNMLGEGGEALAGYKREFEKYCKGVEIWETPYRWRGARWWAQLAWSPLSYHHYAAQALWSPELEAGWKIVLGPNRGAIVHFDSIDLVRYFAAAEGFRRALNHHNCESVMAARRADNEPHPLKKAYLRNQAAKIARAEQEWCPKVDVNLAVSELDAERLRAACPGAHFHVVENGTDTDYFVPSDVPPEPNTLIFAGGLSWYPNVSGIQYFVREIWPQVKRRCPGVRLCVAGRSPCRAVAQLAARDPDITLVADPEDIRPWVWRAAVFVCPILDGGGTRLKILDALAMGKTVVTTSIGIEGLDLRPEEHVLIADSPKDFADQTLRALADSNMRHRLGLSGSKHVKRLYSWEVIADHLEAAYHCALQSPGCVLEGAKRARVTT